MRDTHLRQRTGLNLVGFWERGKLRPAYPQSQIQPDSVIVVAGTASADRGAERAASAPTPSFAAGADHRRGQSRPGGGAGARRKGLTVHAIDRTAAALARLAPTSTTSSLATRPTASCWIAPGSNARIGAAHDQRRRDEHLPRRVLPAAQSATLRIVSRITHERNVEAIHRAGADFVLELHDARHRSRDVPAARTRAGAGGRGRRVVHDSRAAQPGRQTASRVAPSVRRTGLSVVALNSGDQMEPQLTAETVLSRGHQLLMLGSRDQRGVSRGVRAPLRACVSPAPHSGLVDFAYRACSS